MKALCLLVMVLLGSGIVRAEMPREIDPLYFMVGALACTHGTFLGRDDEPGRNEVEFFPCDERAAGLFLEAARRWTGRKEIAHYEKEGRLVIADREVAERLREFFRHDQIQRIPWRGRRRSCPLWPDFMRPNTGRATGPSIVGRVT